MRSAWFAYLAPIPNYPYSIPELRVEDWSSSVQNRIFPQWWLQTKGWEEKHSWFFANMSGEDSLYGTQHQKLSHVSWHLRCGFCTHFRCFFPGFALDFTAFSFSCFFFHATATWKELSAQPPSVPWASPGNVELNHQRCNMHATAAQSGSKTPLGRAPWGGTPAAPTGWPRALPGAAGRPSPRAPGPWPRPPPSRWSSRHKWSFCQPYRSAPSTFVYSDPSSPLALRWWSWGPAALARWGCPARPAPHGRPWRPRELLRRPGPLRCLGFTEKTRLVQLILFPLESSLGNLTCQAISILSHLTLGIPLCFAMLFLLNLFGFCTPQVGSGFSAAATAIGASSSIFSSEGFTSSAARPTDSKTSTPCMAWLPPEDESRRRPFSSKAQQRPAQTEVGRSSSTATSWYNPCCGPCCPDAGSTEQGVALWENATPHLVVLHSNRSILKWQDEVESQKIWWWDELLCWLGTILLRTPWCITFLQKPFNDKLCSVRRVGPACSSRYLLGALVATCPGASEMRLPAGKVLKKHMRQLFEVTCLLSQLLSQPCLIYKKQLFESKA